jgi:hypothetical protein
MAEVKLTAHEAAYLRVFAQLALEARIFRDTIDDEASRIIGNALATIGQQLTLTGYEDSPRKEDLLPRLYELRAYPDLDLDVGLLRAPYRLAVH